MYSGDELELIDPVSALWYAQFVFQLPHCGSSYAHMVCFDRFIRSSERVRAAGIRPHSGKCNFLVRSTLKQQLAIGRSEYESAEGSMQHALLDVLHQVAFIISEACSSSEMKCNTVFLGRHTLCLVLRIDEDQWLFQKLYLGCIICLKLVVFHCANVCHTV